VLGSHASGGEVGVCAPAEEEAVRALLGYVDVGREFAVAVGYAGLVEVGAPRGGEVGAGGTPCKCSAT